MVELNAVLPIQKDIWFFGVPNKNKIKLNFLDIVEISIVPSLLPVHLRVIEFVLEKGRSRVHVPLSSLYPSNSNAFLPEN